MRSQRAFNKCDGLTEDCTVAFADTPYKVLHTQWFTFFRFQFSDSLFVDVGRLSDTVHDIQCAFMVIVYRHLNSIEKRFPMHSGYKTDLKD
jgi:hypothetical protein